MSLSRSTANDKAAWPCAGVYLSLLVLAAVSTAVLLLGAPPFLGILAGGALFLLLPGCLLAEAILPRPADWLERVLISLGAGYVFSTLLLLFLHFLPGAITLPMLVIALDVSIVVLAVVSFLSSSRHGFPSQISRTGLRSHAPLKPAARPENAERTSRAASDAWDNMAQSVTSVTKIRVGWFQKRKTLILIILLVILAFFFRFANLGYSEYQGDEVDVTSRALAIILGQDEALFTHRKGPVEIVVATAFALFSGGFDEFALRFPFALASALAVLVAFALARRIAGEEVAFLAGALLTLEGFFLGFSRLVQYQGIVALMLTLALYCFYRLRESRPLGFSKPEGSVAYQLLGVIFLTFGLLTHYESILIALPILFLCWRKGYDFFRERKGLLLISLGLAVFILCAYYLPFILSPYFAEIFSEYGGHRISLERAPFNNLALYFSSQIVYNSTWYVAFMFVALIVFCARELRRAWGEVWLWLAPTLLFVVGLMVSAFFPEALLLGGRHYNVALFLPLVGLLWLAPGLKDGIRIICLWFFAYFVTYAFLFREPGFHYYCLSPAWAILAAMGVASLLEKIEKKRLAWVAVGILYLLFAFYTFTVFIRNDIEYILAFPQHKTPLYWMPHEELPRLGLFGFPHQSGWKVIGYLYRDGDLRGDYDTNEGPETKAWYTRDALPLTGRPKYFLKVKHSIRRKYQDQVPPDLEEEYALVGRVLVGGQPKMWIYQAVGSNDLSRYYEGAGEPVDYRAEDYQERYNAAFSLANRRLWYYDVAEPVLRQMAAFLQAACGEDEAVILPAHFDLLDYYWRRDAPLYTPSGEEGFAEALARALTLHPRVYAIQRSDDLSRYYNKLAGRHFGGLFLALYAPEGPGALVGYLEGYRLGASIEPVAYELGPSTVGPGQTVRLTLYWSAWEGIEDVQEDYTVFVHLIDDEGRTWSQQDKQPHKPTSRWIEGQVIKDEFALFVAEDAPPGEYRLEVGMYDWRTGQRLEIFLNGQRVEEDRILLPQRITVK